MIEHQFEFRRLRNWNIAGLLPVQKGADRTSGMGRRPNLGGQQDSKTMKIYRYVSQMILKLAEFAQRTSANSNSKLIQIKPLPCSIYNLFDLAVLHSKVPTFDSEPD